MVGLARAGPGPPRPEARRWCRARGGAQRRRLDQIRLNSAVPLVTGPSCCRSA